MPLGYHVQRIQRQGEKKVTLSEIATKMEATGEIIWYDDTMNCSYTP